MNNTDAARIAARYPKPRPRAWLWVALAVAVIGLGWITWLGLGFANPPVSAKVVGYEFVSDTEVKASVTFQRSSTDVSGSCVVFAQGADFGRVGEVTVNVGPGGEIRETKEVRIKTFHPAAAVSVERCLGG